MEGRLPDGRVAIYDDDHYYMGSVLAEFLAHRGCQVSLVTPAPLIAYWSQFTLEQEHSQLRLMKLGVNLYTQQLLRHIHRKNIIMECAVSGATSNLPADAVVLVTDRLPNDAHYHRLKPALAEGVLDSLRVIGDAEAPNIIAQAVFSGHLAAREFGETPDDGVPFQIEHIEIKLHSGAKVEDSAVAKV